MKIRTIIDVLVKPIKINQIRSKVPIELSSGGIKILSFNRFSDVQHLLQSVAALKINPVRINTKVKFTPNINSQRIEYNVIFKSQSELFRKILDDKKDEIRVETDKRYDRIKRNI